MEKHKERCIKSHPCVSTQTTNNTYSTDLVQTIMISDWTHHYSWMSNIQCIAVILSVHR